MPRDVESAHREDKRSERSVPIARWPPWWEWELTFADHLEERMEERGVSEVELRAMLADAQRLTAGRQRGRWLVWTRFRQEDWCIVVEPDPALEQVVAITLFPRRLLS